MPQEAKHSVSFLSDLPAEHDILDYKAYRDALISIIDNLTAETSLTIAVFGDWGSGKTTLLKMIQEELRTHNAQTIWVNVWQFGSEEDVWTAFLQSLLLKIKKEIGFGRRLMFDMGLFRRQINWEKVNKKVPELVIRVLIVSIPLYFSLRYLNTTSPSEQGKIAAGAGTLLATVLGWFLLLQPYIKAVRERVKVDLTGLVKSSQLRERVSLLDQFKTYFEDIVVTLVGKKGRAIIFIDDLDRCQPDRIVQVLDAIKLFLDIPRCVYLIGLDREIVEQAIKIKFEKYQRPESEAREYLEKIIGLPFDLPPLSGSQMEVLVNGLASNLPDSARSTQVFALGQEPNPRKVKRTINMFLLLWLLAQGRKELKGVIKPTRLAKIVVLQHSYRDLYIILTLFPKYLGELEAYFKEHEKRGALGDSVDETGTPQEPPPEHLKIFVADEKLQRLLTLHPHQDKENDEANFTVWQDGKYRSIPEDEIRAYIGLTRSISPSQKKERFSRSSSVFIDRTSELEIFSKILSEPNQPRILLVNGPAGIGKTMLLNRYAQVCSDKGIPSAYVYSYYDRNLDLFDFMKVILDALQQANIGTYTIPGDKLASSSREQFESVSGAFFQSLKKLAEDNKVVIFIDDYERTTLHLKSWIENEFLRYVGNMSNIIVCIASREGAETRSFSELPLSAHTFVLSLSSFTKQDVAEYLRQLEVEIPAEVVEILHTVSGGNPSQVQSAARVLINPEG